MITRLLTDRLTRAKKSVLLLGPRQTGKSTLIKSLAPDLSINLSSESEFFRFSAQPDLLESMLGDFGGGGSDGDSGGLKKNQNPKTIFIDEIQRVPSLLNTIQAILDDRPKPPRFFLTGSSARKLRRGQANLLPGRIFTFELSGLCARELEYRMDLKKALAFGALPEPYLEANLADCAKLLRTYSATYLKEEIQAEALARSIPGFARFLSTAAELSGQICDFSKIATKSKVSRSSCIRFTEILEDTLIAQRVTIFDQAIDADVIRHPKLYFFDTGVLNGLLGSFDLSQDRIGALFEHFIYGQLRNSALALDEPIEIQYFRTRSGLEVDFVVKLRGQVWAIEVKAGEIHSGDLDGLRAFRKYFPKTTQCVAVGMREVENRKRTQDHILICSWVDMLRAMEL